jgi:hypothetical protein
MLEPGCERCIIDTTNIHHSEGNRNSGMWPAKGEEKMGMADVDVMLLLVPQFLDLFSNRRERMLSRQRVGS